MQSSHQQSWQAREKNRGRDRTARDLRRVSFVLVFLLLAAALAYFLFPPFFAPKTHLVLIGSQPDDTFNLPPIAYVGEDLKAFESVRGAQIHDQSPVWQAARSAGRIGDQLAATGATKSDTLVVYLSAHGVSDQGKAYLLCDNFDLRRPDSGRIAVEKLISQISQSPAATKLILLNSGTIEYDPRMGMVANEFPRLLERAVLESGDRSLWVYCSHRTLQQSHLSRAAKRSVFGMFVGEALKGAADLNQDDEISLSEFVGFTSANISRWVSQSTDNTARQTPHLIWGGGEQMTLDPTLLTLYADDDRSKLTVADLIGPVGGLGAAVDATLTSGQSQGLLRRHYASVAPDTNGASIEPDPGSSAPASDSESPQPDGPDGQAAAEATKPSDSATEVAESDFAAAETPGKSGAATKQDASAKLKQLLARAWQQRDQSAQQWSPTDLDLNPIENRPQLWRELQSELLGYEQEARGGIAFDAKPIATILTDTLSAKVSAKPSDRTKIGTLLGRSAASDLLIETQHIHSLALADLVAQSSELELSIDIGELRAAIDKPDRKALEAWLKKFQASKWSELYELHFLSGLVATEDLQWGLIQQLAQTCLLGEQVAALDLLAPGWVRRKVERADQLRFFAEQLAIDRIGSDWPERAEQLAQQALEIYEDAERDFNEVRQSQWQRDVLLARMPYYLKWMHIAGPVAGGHLGSTDRLATLLEHLAQLSDRLEQPETTGIDELIAMRSDLQTLQTRFESNCGDALAQKLLNRSPAPGDSYQADLLLTIPLLSAQPRSGLVAGIDGQDRQLASGYDLAKVIPQDLSLYEQSHASQMPAKHEWGALYELAELELQFVRLSGGGNDQSGSAASGGADRVATAFAALRNAHQSAVPAMTIGQQRSADATERFEQLWSAHAEFGAALQSFYRSAGRPPVETNVCAIDVTNHAIRMLRMADPRDAWRLTHVDVASLSKPARTESTLQWQAARLDQAATFRDASVAPILADDADDYRTKSSLLCGRSLVADSGSQIDVVGPREIDLQYGDDREITLQLTNRGHADAIVSLSVDYESDLIDLTPLIAADGTALKMGFVQPKTEFGTRHSLPIQIQSGQTIELPFRVARQGIASDSTKLVVDVFSHPSDDQIGGQHSELVTRLLGRQTMQVALPVGEVFVQQGSNTFISGADGVTLLPFPNRLEQFKIGVVNRSARSKQISIDCYSLATAIDLGSADPAEVIAAAKPLAKFDVSAAGDGRPVFPAAGEPKAEAEKTPAAADMPKTDEAKPEEAAAEPIKSTPMPQGMLVALTDNETGQTTYRQVSFAVQRPRRFVLPRVGYDANKKQIQIHVAARDKSLLPTGGEVRVTCRLAGRASGTARGKLQCTLSADQLNASMFVAVPSPPPHVERVYIDVDDYPRAFVFDVQCGKHLADVPEATDLVDLRMTTASDDGILAAANSIPVAIEMDTPVGSFESGQDQLQIGIDTENTGMPDPSSSVLLTSDRSVTIGFVKSMPNGTIEFNSEVSDFMIDLPAQRLENLNVGVAGLLTVNDQTVQIPSIPLLIDTAPPLIGPVNRSAGVGFVTVNSAVEFTAWSWDEGAGVKTVEAAFDADGSGEFPESGGQFTATPLDNRQWALTVNAGAETGQRTLLVRSVDRVGNASEPLSVIVEVVSAVEGVALVKQQTVDLIGDVLLRDKAVSAELKLIAIPEDPAAPPASEDDAVAVQSDADGHYTIAGVAPGSYRLAARSVIRNRVHRVEQEVVVTPGPKRSMRVDVKLP
ncbi:carboxypeptidase-like regulatory domain-containing protein [Stieleria sp. TO1_6]|uniref:carboxypeptidase-like regulatory domain-containing protein n=1 Tax=Stieleria tagensis TaxID=2956795 RepID=UPI00209AFB49|nr:carboxypeptidase-like regulatory domain-containing protein [Stieleria tagensis]MCO8120433.1 carboxypeptidase-like regulatory domain-containing protein [Stieleria tagensis]